MTGLLDPSALLSLPDYARVDLAWEERVLLPTGSGPGDYTLFKGEGERITFVRSVFMIVRTSAVVSTRSLQFQVINSVGNVLINDSGDVVFPANSQYQATFLAGSNMTFTQGPILGVAYNATISIPLFPLYPGDIATLLLTGSAGDLYDGGAVVFVHVPTGPTLIEEIDAVSSVTPVLF